jgi:hypothetical protein
VLVGRLGQRVAYASLVVFDDLDANGELDLIRAQRCSRGDGEGEDQGGDPSMIAEPIYAASFARLTRPSVRVSYVEGPFDRASNYYPAPKGCDAFPPGGFSIWMTGDYLDPNAGCRVGSFEQEVMLELGPAAPNADLACPQRTRDVFPRPPSDRAPSPRVLTECNEDGSLALTDPECACPNLRLMTLRGCETDYGCVTPEWDVKTPPAWYPCAMKGPSGPLSASSCSRK